MTQLRFSIAMCTYNGSRFILEQLESIVNQSYPPCEVIICDDGSRDNTCELVEEFQEKYPNLIKLYKNDINIGRNKNFSQAIGLCEGDIIALSDQDDVFLPNKLEWIAKVLKSNLEFGLVFSNAIVVDESLSTISKDLFSIIWPPFTERRKRCFRQGEAFQVLVRNRPALGCSIAFRKELRDFLLPIPAEFSHDAWIMLLASLLSKIYFIDRSLVMYRQHDANIAGVQKGIVRKLRKRMAGRSAGDLFDEVSRELDCWESLRARLQELNSQGVLGRSISRDDASLMDSKINYLRTRKTIAHKDTPAPIRFAMMTFLLVRGQYFLYEQGLYSLFRDIAVSFLRLKENALGPMGLNG